MRVHVLGSAAGGGFPQWNCNCRNCAGLRHGAIRAQARTQSWIAIGAGEDWDTFVAATKILRGAPAKPWWAYTKQRKAVYGAV